MLALTGIIVGTVQYVLIPYRNAMNTYCNEICTKAGWKEGMQAVGGFFTKQCYCSNGSAIIDPPD